MKVQTHVKAGEFAAVGASSANGHAGVGTLSSTNGQRLLDSQELESLRQFLNHEIKPWFMLTYTYSGEGQAQESQLRTSSSFVAMDRAAQAFVRDWIDPLLGDSRSRQLQVLSATGELAQTSLTEIINNRYLGASVATLALALAGSLVFSPLLVVATAGVVYMCLPIYAEAYRSVTQHHKVNVAVLAGLNVTGAWLGGYYIAAALGFFLYNLGQKLVYKTQDRSQRSLVNVFGQQPRSIWVLVDGLEIEIPFERVEVGDTVVVQAGQTVPVDGTITQGIATIDQHTLTGEAQPVEKGVGDAVLATTVVLTGMIHIRVEKAGQETAAAQIADMLNRTASYQMSIESQALALANRASLPVLIFGALALPIVGYEGAVAVLGANLGLTLRLTSPLAMLNYLNILSHSGILIKDGRSLELLDKVDTIVFDKTGTLTLEQPHVARVHLYNGLSEDELLTLAATAEQRQSHPIAQAILAAAHAHNLALRSLDEAHYEVGFGIKVRIGSQVIRIGSPRFMELERITLPDEVRHVQETCAKQGHSLVLVAVDEQVGGALELHATVRPEARQMIETLHQRKLTLYILSGDQEAPTRRLAHELGIDHYIAGVLPEDKAAVIEQLQGEGKSICFVGDGINDGIALKKAHVSISLRGATTVATDAAQIVLMDQSLQQLPHLFEIGREFEGNMRRGFASALGPDALLIGGVFLAHFGIYASVMLFNIGLLAGLGNALWPLLKHKGTTETMPLLPAPAREAPDAQLAPQPV